MFPPHARAPKVTHGKMHLILLMILQPLTTVCGQCAHHRQESMCVESVPTSPMDAPSAERSPVEKGTCPFQKYLSSGDNVGNPPQVDSCAWREEMRKLISTHLCLFPNITDFINKRGILSLRQHPILVQYLMSHHHPLRPLSDWKSAASFSKDEYQQWAEALQCARRTYENPRIK